MSHLPRRVVIVVAAVLLLGSPVHAQPSQALAVPPESRRWELEGEARASEYQGRQVPYNLHSEFRGKDLEDTHGGPG